MSESNTMADNLLDQILLTLLTEGIDIQKIKPKLVVLMDGYKIEPKETALAIYTNGKNEMLLKKFILAKAVAGRSERTIKQYAGEIRRFQEKIGKDFDCISPDDIRVYIARLITSGKSKSYADTVRRYLNSFYGYLYREELIKTNPMMKVDAVKFKVEKENAFSDLEVELLRQSCRTSHERAVIETLLSTGCRASEVVTLLIDDIKEGKAQILGKGGKYRTVYFNAKAAVAIETYLKERRDKNPYLFPAGIFIPDAADSAALMQKTKGNWYKYPELIHPENHWNKESVNKMCQRIAKRAGVSGAHAHRFRRTCATHALRHGMPIEIVSMMLGHEQISTTQIYLDIREDDLAAAHKKYVL